MVHIFLACLVSFLLRKSLNIWGFFSSFASLFFAKHSDIFGDNFRLTNLGHGRCKILPTEGLMDETVLWYRTNQKFNFILSWWKLSVYSLWLLSSVFRRESLSLSFISSEEVFFFGYRWDFFWQIIVSVCCLLRTSTRKPLQTLPSSEDSPWGASLDLNNLLVCLSSSHPLVRDLEEQISVL